MTNQTETDSCNEEFKISVGYILLLFWDMYASLHSVSDFVQHEVKKALQCRNGENVFSYMCEDCGKIVYQKLGCNSRLCSMCGKRYTDQWAKSLSKAMFKIPHRHIVLSVPPQLWKYLKNDRKLWKVYMDSAIDTFNDYFPKILRNRFIKVGVIVILHPFGKDLKFQPHLHCIITEGGFDQKGNFVKKDFIPAREFARCWQYHVSKNLQDAGVPNDLISELYKKYDGFYVWLHRSGRIEHPKDVAKYIGRYVRHPAIANSRIISLENKIVTFFYKEHRDGKENTEFVDMDVSDFISALIQHIPDKQFRMIRYYGAYARRSKKFFCVRVIQSTITSEQISLRRFVGPKMIPKCPHCNGNLIPLHYQRIPPPGDHYHYEIKKENMVNWISVN